MKSVCRQRKSYYEFKLYIEVGFQEKACEIFIKTFQLEPSCYTFAASAYLETLEVIGCWRPKLVLFWPTLVITSDVTAEKYNLPRSVKLSWIETFTLRKMLKQSFWCVLMAKTSKGETMLALTKAPAYPTSVGASAPVLYPGLT